MLALLLACGSAACERESPRQAEGAGAASSAPLGELATASASAAGASNGTAVPEVEPRVAVAPSPRCSPEMVKVSPALVAAPEHGAADALEERRWLASALAESPRPYCVDRFEGTLVDAAHGDALSPYYPPSKRGAVRVHEQWRTMRLEVGDEEARALGLPLLPAWQRVREPVLRAASREGVVPNGHTSGVEARAACAKARKRLCTPSEWRIACGGADGFAFPYGAEYRAGACNVFREAHPAAVLHGNASRGHDDPRLNTVRHRGLPLLRKTGATRSCKSRWGDDAIYDMVGNLDEWLAHDAGSFAGGFYARSTKLGCDWRTTAHGNGYADYSTGVRCCASLPDVAPGEQ